VVIKKKQRQRSVQNGAVQENPAVRSYGALFVSLGILFTDDEFILKLTQDIPVILNNVYSMESFTGKTGKRPYYAHDKHLTEQATIQNDEDSLLYISNRILPRTTILNSRR
jgi:hypothetical protein